MLRCVSGGVVEVVWDVIIGVVLFLLSGDILSAGTYSMISDIPFPINHFKFAQNGYLVIFLMF